VRTLFAFLCALFVCPRAAHAQIVLRMGTVVPEGTAWAREIRRFQQWVDEGTHGQVRIKTYFGGIAGDELDMVERIKRDQLDGAFSGGALCMRLAPAMRVMRVVGLFQGRSELGFVLGRLKPSIDEEFRRAGFHNFGLVGVGPELMWLRRPTNTLAEAKATRLWTWSDDNTLGPGLAGLGFNVFPATLADAGRLYDERKVDGFVSTPSAALAFQWSSRSKYLLPLRIAALEGCVIVANRAWDPLSEEHKAVIKAATARGITHLEEVSRAQDEALLGGLLEKQGVHMLPVSAAMRAQFFDQARAFREQVTARSISPALLERVLSLLADYRAEHRLVEGD
jgi:TRAP-type transport system periplasmic protein